MRASAVVVVLSLWADAARGQDDATAPSCATLLRDVKALVASRGRIPLTDAAAPRSGDVAADCDPPAALGPVLQGAGPADGIRICTVSDRKVAVAVTGPSGTGRYWTVALAATAPRGTVASTCVETTTVAWRGIPPRLLRAGPLPRWDVCPADIPGRIEIWHSLPASEEAGPAEHVLVSVVYALQGLELAVDDTATRRRAGELAGLYRTAAGVSGTPLHAAAAEALEVFGAGGSCPAGASPKRAP